MYIERAWRQYGRLTDISPVLQKYNIYSRKWYTVTLVVATKPAQFKNARLDSIPMFESGRSQAIR